jgi:hypothetical protein
MGVGSWLAAAGVALFVAAYVLRPLAGERSGATERAAAVAKRSPAAKARRGR